MRKGSGHYGTRVLLMLLGTYDESQKPSGEGWQERLI